MRAASPSRIECRLNSTVTWCVVRLYERSHACSSDLSNDGEHMVKSKNINIYGIMLILADAKVDLQKERVGLLTTRLLQIWSAHG